MSKYAGNQWDDSFASLEEAIAVTRYRMAEELYRSATGLYVVTDKCDPIVKTHVQMLLDDLEPILNGNRQAHRDYITRMEKQYAAPQHNIIRDGDNS